MVPKAPALETGPSITLTPIRSMSFIASVIGVSMTKHKSSEPVLNALLCVIYGLAMISFNTFAGLPPITTLSPKLFVTTAPEATTTLLPRVTPGLITA